MTYRNGTAARKQQHCGGLADYIASADDTAAFSFDLNSVFVEQTYNSRRSAGEH